MSDAVHTIVASSTSRGGHCAHESCRRRILSGEPIAKVWDGRSGYSTQQGQGPGEWWCVDCAAELAPDAA